MTDSLPGEVEQAFQDAFDNHEAHKMGQAAINSRIESMLGAMSAEDRATLRHLLAAASSKKVGIYWTGRIDTSLRGEQVCLECGSDHGPDDFCFAQMNSDFMYRFHGVTYRYSDWLKRRQNRLAE